MTHHLNWAVRLRLPTLSARMFREVCRDTANPWFVMLMLATMLIDHA
jgi:hypothetical protein